MSNKNIVTVVFGMVMLSLAAFMLGLYVAPVPRLEGIGCEGVNAGAYDGSQKLYANEEDMFPRCAVIQTNAWWR